MKKIGFNIGFALGAAALLFTFASCDALQDSLSSEQKKDQTIDIGTVTTDSTTYYFNGKEGENVKGDEAHLVLNLGQIADATDALALYTLSYKLNDVSRTVADTGKGTLSDSKRRFYLDVSPATNLIDGSGDISSDDISLAVTVSGLKNASGNDYNGYSLPKFSKTITFAPLYLSEPLVFSTKTATAGTVFSIPLNGKITAIDSAVTATATSGTLPATTFTAAVSDDGTKILITSSADLTGVQCIADLSITGIKPVGGKESYAYTFKDVDFEPLLVVVDGSLSDEVWKTAPQSTDSYANPSGYNLSAVHVTNDDNYLYVAVEGDLSLGSGDNIIVMIDNTSSSSAGMASTDSGINDYLVSATNMTYSSVDFYLCHLQGTDLHSRVWGPRSDGVDVATGGSITVAEYKIPLALVANAVAGNTLKVFVSASAYTWVENGNLNTFALQDCIPSAAATVTGGGQTVSIDFGKALEYTVQ